MQEARATVARGLGLASAAEVDAAWVMGIFYACQTDLTLLAPLHGGGSGDKEEEDHHAAWIAGSAHLGSGPLPPSPSSSPSSSFSACALLPGPLLEAMEAREDRENFHTRGFGLPAAR